MLLKLSEILPNPNRDFDKNPLDEDRVEELMLSIHETGFWDNCVVRNNNNKWEAAYGAHRLEAAKRAGLTEADFIVKDFDDEQMIKVMDYENSSYRYSILSLLESVRAVVVGLAEGRVRPFEIDPNTSPKYIYYAPSFIPGRAADFSAQQSKELRYTASSIAKFRGQVKSDGKKQKANDAITAALNALRLIELGKLTEYDVRAFNVDQLLNMTRDLLKRHEMSLVSRDKGAKEAAVARQELLRQQEEVKKLEAEQAAKDRELAKQIAEAERKRNEKRMAELAEEKARNDKQAGERRAVNEESRKVLDKKVEDYNASVAASKVEDKDLVTRYKVRNLFNKLKLIPSERYALREEIKAVGRDRAVTLKERQQLWQAAQDAGEWFLGYASAQLSTAPVSGATELRELRHKEEAKQAKKEKTA